MYRLERNYQQFAVSLSWSSVTSTVTVALLRNWTRSANLRAMKMHYDEQVDALYLSLDESDVLESEEVKPGIILDFNAAGEVVGIEVLDVKRRVPGADLKELQFEVASAGGR